MILKYIIENNHILKKYVREDDVKFICSLIDPSKSNIGFIYQIISNPVNSIDVDKFDYITRDNFMLGFKSGFDFSRLVDEAIVIDNKICYPKQVYFDIYWMFLTRYRLHKQVYCHKTVIAIQYMIYDILILLDPIVNFSSCINNVVDFCKLTEPYIINKVQYLYDNMDKYSYNLHDNIKNAYQLLKFINNRKLYSLIRSSRSDTDTGLSVDVIKKYIQDNKVEYYFDFDKIVIYRNKIGFVSGDKPNPLENIYTYDTKVLITNELPKLIPVKKSDFSLLGNDNYQEHLLMVFYKGILDTSIKNNINEVIDRVTNAMSD